MSNNEFNEKVIKEFRENDGVVGGPFEGAPILLLTTTGAKSGEKRTTPLVYLADGDRYVIFASQGGAPTHPGWYHNIVKSNSASIEVGTETFDVTPEVVDEPQRSEYFAQQVALMPPFAQYEVDAAPRVIPVVSLQRS